MSEHKKPVGLYIAGLVLVAVAAAGVVLLAVQRRNAVADEGRTRQGVVEAGPRVKVAKATLTPADRTVTLPGEVRAWQQATLYAKISGYLKEIRVDKGDRVKKGQILAVIESPETEQLVRGAAADLEVKVQNRRRAEGLVKQAVVSQQELEQAIGSERVAQAALSSAKAQQDYGILRAPFSGIVTARYADPGALLPAATGTTQSAQAVVDVADMDTLRVYVYLGQDDARAVRVGDLVNVNVSDRGDSPVAAKVTRIARSLDPRTRTMLTEVDLKNDPAKIYPGEYVHVGVNLHGVSSPQVPSLAIIFTAGKLQVAEVREGRVHFVPVEVGTDDGVMAQVTAGLHGDELVALNIAGELEEGDRVQPVASAPSTAAPVPGKAVPASAAQTSSKAAAAR